jgi:hypothetical protein
MPCGSKRLSFKGVPNKFPGGQLIPQDLRRKLAKEIYAIRKGRGI